MFKIDDIDANKILVSKKESYGTKNFNQLNTLLDILAMMTLGHLLCIKLHKADWVCYIFWW